MQEILSVKTMRDSDAATIREETPGRELMLRAARGVVERADIQGPAAVLCGSGNNGGDGYAIPCLLAEKNVPVTVLRLSRALSEDGAYYLEQCLERNVPVRFYEAGEDLSGWKTLVDCLFGTGLSRPAEGLYADAIRQMNASGAFTVAVDIPSGINGDSGLGDPAVRADQTVSVGSLKPGHFLGQAKDVRGELINCDIGIRPLQTDARLMEEKDAAACLPQRRNYSHKGAYAYVGLAGGCLAYNGAPRLAAMASAAMKSGAGVAVAAVPKSLVPAMIPYTLESTAFPLSETEDGAVRFEEAEWELLCSRCRVIAFGMGIGRGEEVRKALAYLLAHFEGRLIIDADGLTELAGLGCELLKTTRAQVLLTPHLGEASRLLSRSVKEIEAKPLELAKDFAARFGCTLLLKGPATIVTDGDEAWITDRGCPGMATAGSGDVLSGVLAAVLGYSKASLPKAAAAAAYLCGAAGERAQDEIGPTAMTASDTVRALPQAVRRLELVRDRTV